LSLFRLYFLILWRGSLLGSSRYINQVLILVKLLVHFLFPHLLQKSFGRRWWLSFSFPSYSWLSGCCSNLWNYFFLICYWLWLNGIFKAVGLFFDKILWRIFIESIWNLFVAIEVVVKVKDMRKCVLIINFVSALCEVIKMESLKHYIEKFWKLDKSNSSFSSYFFVTWLTKI